ncbi:MAG TPA: chalcone isomerase family protein [Thermoanaerobaculaceae bacterium]|nr:chalcone isomerase family protein [Thermoanaerobaculaceae bacterium]HPS78854.1 chalcone isomerase family protein [Thermoanaerobaculaceae bacterium]
MRVSFLVAGSLLMTSMAFGTELAGVTLPDTAQVGSASLKLNGAGIRKKLFIKVYVGGLYLPAPTSSPAAILGADETRRMVMHFVYKEVDAAKVTEAFREGFANNSAASLGALQARLDAFCALWPAMHAGDLAEMTYVPGTGTTLVINDKNLGVTAGKDFADALFLVWLGDKPADAGLKEGLLGT